MNINDLFVKRLIESIRNLCSILVLVMLGILFFGVFARYVFNHPIIWSEEITLILLIWFGFFSISNELYEEKHMSIEFLFNRLKPKTQKIASIINSVLQVVFFIIMLYELIVITVTIRDSKLPVSGLPKIIMYIPVVLSSLLMVLYSLALFLKKAGIACGKRPGNKGKVK